MKTKKIMLWVVGIIVIFLVIFVLYKNKPDCKTYSNGLPPTCRSIDKFGFGSIVTDSNRQVAGGSTMEDCFYSIETNKLLNSNSIFKNCHCIRDNRGYHTGICDVESIK